MMDYALLVKVNYIALGTRVYICNSLQTLEMVPKQQIIKILQESCGTIELTEDWERSILKSLNRSKRISTPGKVEPSAKLLAKKKLTFQKAIVKIIQDNDIPLDIVMNLD